MKVCALICSHSDPIYTKLTISSLIYHLGGNHELSIHVGVHSNYSDYTNDFSLFNEYGKMCQFHVVDEIDWSLYNQDIYRYSKMHSKNLENLLKNVKYYDFDCLLILDNDLHIKDDFVTKHWNGEDIVGSLFDDNNEIRLITEIRDGENINFMPKLSVWNIMISRLTYDKIMEDTSIIYPDTILPVFLSLPLQNKVFFDTFAKVYYYGKNKWNLNIKILDTSIMEESIKHYFKSSFNYGMKVRTEKEFFDSMSDVINLYRNKYEPFIKVISKSFIC